MCGGREGGRKGRKDRLGPADSHSGAQTFPKCLSFPLQLASSAARQVPREKNAAVLQKHALENREQSGILPLTGGNRWDDPLLQ